MVADNREVVDSPREWVADHIRRYVETDGADGHIRNGFPALLLTTRGRKSGQLRRTALYYGRDGDNYVVVASAGGADDHPLWYKNLTADPNVQVQVLADVFAARARTATPEERARLWPVMAAIYPPYDEYQTKTSREIPVVILERA